MYDVILARPEIAKSDRVIEELDDSVFVIAFQDGTARMMSLAELMVFTYNLLMLAYQNIEVAQMMQAMLSPAPCKVASGLRCASKRSCGPRW